MAHDVKFAVSNRQEKVPNNGNNVVITITDTDMEKKFKSAYITGINPSYNKHTQASKKSDAYK